MPAVVAGQRKSPLTAVAARRLAQTLRPPDWQLDPLQRRADFHRPMMRQLQWVGL